MIAAQLLGNGGKIEPYAIIIMDQLNNIRNDFKYDQSVASGEKATNKKKLSHKMFSAAIC
jgi:calcineurin-like phosphoesterase